MQTFHKFMRRLTGSWFLLWAHIAFFTWIGIYTPDKPELNYFLAALFGLPPMFLAWCLGSFDEENENANK